MYEWHRQVQAIVNRIDASILSHDDEALTLRSLSELLGYSPYHTTRMFHALSGMPLRQYLRQRRLAFALIAVRDTRRTFLDIALDHGFTSHEAFTRAFSAAYGVTPKAYRQCPRPVVLRTRINTFDRYILGLGEIGMITSNEAIKVYFVSIPAHSFLHIKNYESDGYFDFWTRQDAIPGQDCDTICGLLDSVAGKLDSVDETPGRFSGQVMARLYEADGRQPEAYGVRLPQGYDGPVPAQMALLEVPEGAYIVFEHGPFDYEQENETVAGKLAEAMAGFDYAGTDYRPDQTPGRVSYFYHDQTRYQKRILPVARA